MNQETDSQPGKLRSKKSCGIDVVVLLILGWLMVASDSRALAESADPTAFAEANVLYERGQYADAINLYERLQSNGVARAGIHYNLGNAHYRLGHLGTALSSWRLAQLASPRDRDLQLNLGLVRAKIGAAQRPALARWEEVLRTLSLDEWALASVTIGWLWFLLLLAGRIRPDLGQQLSAVTLLVGMLAGALVAAAGLATWSILGRPLAVVTKPEIHVRLGPLEESRTAFVLKEGAEVRVLDQQGAWLQIESPAQDRPAWIKSNAVVVIRPR